MVSESDDHLIAEANRKVSEDQRFHAQLPALLADPALRGRYVVFKDGVVVSAFDTLADAYSDGVTRFGEYGGMLITRVEEPRVHVISGSTRPLRPGERPRNER